MRNILLILLICTTAATHAQQAAPQADDEFTRSVYFGRKFADMGDYGPAYDNYARANALRPDESGVLYNMAVVLSRAGRYSEAQVAVDRYLREFPAGNERALIDRLQLELEFQRELQKKRQADQLYTERFSRARFLYASGDLEEALKLFHEAEQLRPSDAAAVFNQAIVYEKQGDFVRAVERFRRYTELESDPTGRTQADQRLFALQRELSDMRSKVVCSFCGHKLPAETTWCERCWHGPYLTGSAIWDSRPCISGATATRATYFSDERFNRNDVLPCLTGEGTLLDSIRYTPQRQRAIRDARLAEGWKYDGEMLVSWGDKDGNEIRFEQGTDYLERATSSKGGEILAYSAHAGGPGIWLLDREDLIIDAQRYLNQYEYDSSGRIARQSVSYQNTSACNHLISATADYSYDAARLRAVSLTGGYEGYTSEGSPRADWKANITFEYDEQGRLSREELALESFTKQYAQKAHGKLRDEISRIYPSMRTRKPIDSVVRVGDLCGTSGNQLLSNLIDLRPFYLISPNLNITLANGVAKAVVTFTYPTGFRPGKQAGSSSGQSASSN
jgi:tetratricopeptide (TPR) repeat protein